MEWTTSLAVQVVSALLLAILTGLVTVAVWYFRKYILSEIEANTAMREYLLGTDVEHDDGLLLDLQQMHEDMKVQHEENKQKLDYVILYLQRVANKVDEEVEEPPKKWRGGD